MKRIIFVWIRALRPFSFTASVTPVIVGASLGCFYRAPVSWVFFPFVLICVLLLHGATNLINDFYDFKKGVDTPGSLGSSGVITERLLSPEHIRSAGLFLFVAAFLLGVILSVFRGWPLFLLGCAGIAGGYFYTAGPISYKYRAVGDIFVFLLMGPLMVCGSFYALTGRFRMETVYISFPMGMLVAAILGANNLRDIHHDTQAGIKTLATIVGRDLARLQYAGIILGTYITLAVLIVKRILPPLSLLAAASVPCAFRDIRAVYAHHAGSAERIASLDAATAKHHFLFGMLLSVSLFNA